MKKILYITTVDISSNSGVRKKIYGQVEVMREEGFKVVLIAPMGTEIVALEKEDEEAVVLGQYNLRGPLRFFSLVKVLYSKAYEYATENKVDGVFVRYAISDFYLIRMFRRLKREGIKIFIEIPSYPYDLEYENKQWYKKIGLYIDKIYRKKLKKYVDVLFTPSPEQEDIYGLKTVYFNNGINISNPEKRKYVGFEENTLRFIGVANLNAWHGYDRVIRGIGKYYENKGDINFLFNIVGEGVELPNLKKITKDLGLEERIKFHGKKYGEELNEVYNNSDVAMSSVGFFRLDSIQRTSLKTREACLKSIPFVSVKGDPVFDDNFKYIYLVEDKDTPLDVEGVYDWFLKIDPENYIDEMYDFAKNYLGWNQTFIKPILVMKETLGND